MENSAEELLVQIWTSVNSSARDARTESSIWRGRLPDTSPSVLTQAQLMGWLSSSDIDEMNSRTSPTAAQRLGARRLLRRMIVAASAGVMPSEIEVVMDCYRCGQGGHGFPTLKARESLNWTVSSSSAGDHFMVAISDLSIGADIEFTRAVDHISHWPLEILRLLEIVSDHCPQDASPSILWTALEATAKTTRRGLLTTADELSRALFSHQLTWWTDVEGLTACIAATVPAQEMVVFDLDLLDPVEQS